MTSVHKEVNQHLTEEERRAVQLLRNRFEFDTQKMLTPKRCIPWHMADNLLKCINWNVRTQIRYWSDNGQPDQKFGVRMIFNCPGFFPEGRFLLVVINFHGMEVLRDLLDLHDSRNGKLEGYIDDIFQHPNLESAVQDPVDFAFGQVMEAPDRDWSRGRVQLEEGKADVCFRLIRQPGYSHEDSL